MGGARRQSGSVTITIKSAAVAAKLDKASTHLLEKEMRGVVAVAANEIRDQARSNAIGVGLGQSGPVTYAKGEKYDRHGGIPQSIFAFVQPNAGSHVSAKVAFDHLAAGYDNWYAVLIENGTRFMSARPFFTPAVNDTKGSAAGAASKRFAEAVQRML
jgi:HK97 gp10 family phage protein